MAALFPGAPDLDAYRANLHAGFDAITTVPPDRWDPVFYDPSVTALDRFYGDRGGFVNAHATFDPLDYGVVPSTVAEAEPDQLLVLRLAVDALRDAGIDKDGLPRETTGVYLGRGGYITAGLARSAQRVREGEQVMRILRQVLPDLPAADLARVKEAYRSAAGDLAPDQAIGLVPNLAASRTANRLDLRGPAFTFDAACASALVAIDHAVHALRTGRIDAALVGGAHLCHDPTFWSIFCQLGAMSRTGIIRPFDAHADGLLIGEGVGMVLLERTADAVKQGRRIHAVLHGTGVASDGRGATLMSPSSGGQILATKRAWEDAGLDPRTAGLIEAHGTATDAGDSAELDTIAAFFGRLADGEDPGCIGSVKSMIGHAMPAAGIAGLIKAVIAVEDATFLPTLHVDTPRPELASTRFATFAKAAPWQDATGPRHAGVNAFGFGGIDAHVVVGQAPASPHRPLRTSPQPIALYAAPTPEALAQAVEADVRGGTGTSRLALHDPTPDRRERAAKLVRHGKPIHGRRGTWFSPHGLLDQGGKVAFVFPGVEAAFDASIPQIATALGLDLPAVLKLPAAELDDLGVRGAQIVSSGRLLHAAIQRLGVKPDLLAGHSIGEWTSIIAAGLAPDDAIDGFIASLADETLALPDVVFGALGAGLDKVAPALAGRDDVVLSHDNCPHQAIICGPEPAVREVLAQVKALSEVLPFRSGFHTPYFAQFATSFAPHIARLPLAKATVPVWSSCTVAPWPSEHAAVRALLGDLLVKPVRFTQTIQALHAQGVRVLVQLGAGSLSGFIDDTLKGEPHHAISASDAKRDALEQLSMAAAALWVEGARIDTRKLPQLRDGRGMRLHLGAPLVSLTDPPRLSVPSSATTTPTAPIPGPFGQAFQATLDAVTNAQRDVLAALQAGPQAPAAPAPRTLSVARHLSVATDPYLLDHCLFQQPADWSNHAARYPVVPMTMNLQMMMDAAAELVPHMVIVGMEKVRAWRWLVVEPAVDITIEATWDGDNTVTVEIPGYAEGVVKLADAYPPAPAPTPLQLDDAKPSPVDAETLYGERWMFHGPTYRGVVGLGNIGANGIEGTIEAPPAPGALLDNAGQVYGYWGFVRLPVNSLGFPARIEQITFHGPMPAQGDRFDVRAWVTKVTDETFRGDIELIADGKVWCRLDSWQNRRFETDAVVLPLLRTPGTVSLAEVDEAGVAWVKERWRTTAARDLLVRRYVDGARLDAWTQVPPWEQRRWVLRRIAAAEAVREWLWAQGRTEVFPIEIEVTDTPDGGLAIAGPFEQDLRVAVDVVDGLAAAKVEVGRTPRVRLVKPEDAGRAAMYEGWVVQID